MKKSIVASIIGVVATVAAIESSYGQGFVAFNNYYSATDQTVRFDASGGGGLVSGPAFKAYLLYSFGGSALTPLSAAAGGVQAFSTGGQAGYFIGGTATIPGYTSASGQIQFQVQVYDGLAYGDASNTFQGQSALLTLGSIATGALPVGDLGPGLVAFQVNPVPEPSTLALIGLGTGVLLFLRRRK